jgi:hypothetical protein
VSARIFTSAPSRKARRDRSKGNLPIPAPGQEPGGPVKI